MKKFIITTVLCLAGHALSNAQSSKITVNVSDIENSGTIYFMLYKSEDGFPSETEKAYKSGTVKKYGTTTSFTFYNIPYGEYAVAFYQDENGNGKMDSNFLGIPKESVGASNMKGFGKPSFKKSRFELGEKGKTLNLTFVL